MKLTYYGHACFAVTAGGKHLLFDPFIRPNPLAAKIDVEKIEADFILVSHGHGDHVADVVEIAQRTGATVIAPFEVGSWFEKKGVSNVQPMNHGGAATLPFGRGETDRRSPQQLDARRQLRRESLWLCSQDG